MTKMIPPVPTSAVMMPTPKQKIGFSIESIVGHDANEARSPGAAVIINPNSNGSNAVGETTSNNNNNNNSHSTNTNSAKTAQSINNNNNNNNNDKGASNGPTSPPQTPPAAPIAAFVGSTHLPTTPHLSLPPHAHHHSAHGMPQVHPHMPPHPHLTAAQQHALHQHLLMQQQAHAAKAAGHGDALRHDIQDIIARLHNSAAAAAHHNAQNGPYSPPQTRLSPDESSAHHHQQHPHPHPHPHHPHHLKRERSPVPAAVDHAQNPAQRHQPPHTPPKSVSPQSSHPSSPPTMLPGSPATPQQQQQYPKAMSGPMLMPGLTHAGLVRPFPVGPPQQGPPPQQGMPDIKALPPYINAPPEMSPQHNPHLIAAAQFQMAAAAAAAAGLPPHGSPFMPNPGMARDSYPLYPWLLSRHGRIFPHRFPGNFLLQPFRKPKRIRTAFSPSQLLKLEHAFESNQYVVGAERKALAQSLNLSETQVKVWFQNRRTKHKRMQQEDEKGGGGSGSGDRHSQNGASCDEDDDELIDMEMDDDCHSDDEHDLDASH